MRAEGLHSQRLIEIRLEFLPQARHFPLASLGKAIRLPERDDCDQARFQFRNKQKRLKKLAVPAKRIGQNQVDRFPDLFFVSWLDYKLCTQRDRCFAFANSCLFCFWWIRSEGGPGPKFPNCWFSQRSSPLQRPRKREADRNWLSHSIPIRRLRGTPGDNFLVSRGCRSPSVQDSYAR